MSISSAFIALSVLARAWLLKIGLVSARLARSVAVNASLALALSLVNASSVAQPDLFAARISVEDRREASLARAASEALERVLVRVSGNKAVIELPGIPQAIKSARDSLSLYTYEEDETGLVLIAEFDGVVVKDLLRAAGATYWSAARPPVLVWLVVDELDGRRFANTVDDAELLGGLRSAFDNRGVAMRLPLLDLEDSLVLGPNILWQRVVPRILAASQRYEINHVLVGRHVKLTNGRLLTDWLHLESDTYAEGDTATVQTETTSYALASEVGVDLAVDAMAERYAVSLNEASRQGRLVVAIDGVYSFEDYQHILGLFKGMTLLDEVRVASIAGQRLQLSVSGVGSGDELQRLIGTRSGLSLTPVSDDSDLSLLWEGGKP